MKGIKSKSKSKQKRPYLPPPVSQQTPQKSRKKRTKGGQERRQFLVRFLNGRVVFDMSKAEQFMFSPFNYLFHHQSFNLCDSSGIMRLKAIPITTQKTSFKHEIDTKQAIFLYYKLYRARLGDVDLAKQLHELIEVIDRQKIQHKQGSSQEQFNKEVELLKRKVQEIQKKSNENQEKTFVGSQQEVKLNLLDERIRELGIKLLEMMIVAIRQKDEEDQVDVIFQQSYVDKTCKKDFLLNIIGEEMYIAKKVNFVRLYGYARRNYKANTNFIVCHMCKELIIDEYLRCQKKQNESIIPNYKNSPNVYYQHLLSLNYCHPQFTEPDEVGLLKELDYFKYFNFNQFRCNRFICKKCAQTWVLFQKSQQRVKFTCSFCFGDCLCKSCSVASEIIKALALYRDICQRNNKQKLNRYYQLIKFVNLDDDNLVWLDPIMRNTFRHLERKDYQYYYESLLEKFMMINKVMDNFQKIAIRNYDLFEEMKHMVTRNMAQARKFCLQLISERNTQKQNKMGKSLNTVRSNCKVYQQRLKKKQEDDRQEQMFNLRYLQLKLRKLKPNNKIISLKEKLKTFNTVNGQARRFKVPYQPYDLTDVQNLLNEIQIQQYTNKTESKKYPSVNNDKIKRVMFMKKEVPFEQIDYQLAQNVKKQCIIVDKKELRLRQALNKKLLYESDHFDYGIKGIAFFRYPQNPQQLIQIIKYSDYQQDNDSEKIIEEGISLPQQYSVSYSSFLNRPENQNILTPKQSSNYSQSFSINSEQYVDAGSEEIILNENTFGIIQQPQIQPQKIFDKSMEQQKPHDKSENLVPSKKDKQYNPIRNQVSKQRNNLQDLQFSSESQKPKKSPPSSQSNHIKREGQMQNQKGDECGDSDVVIMNSQEQWSKAKTK